MKIVNLALCIGLVVGGCSGKETPTSSGGGGTPAGANTAANGQPGVPVVLASGQTQPWTIAIDNDNVYWANAGTLGGVYKVAKTGGAITTLYQGAVPELESIGVDASSAYFVAGGNVMAAPIGGGPARVLAPSASLTGVAVASGRVYWVEPPAVGNPTDRGTAESVAITGGSVQKSALTHEATSGSGAFNTVAAADAVYASLEAGGGIIRFPLDSGPVSWIDVNAGTGIGVDSDSILFGTKDTVDVAPLVGGAATHLASAHAEGVIAVDNGFAYLADNDGGQGRVLRVAKAGGAVTELARDQGRPHAVAVDAGYIYWSCLVSGTITRLAK